jgi:LPXTG-site transpeptidase (sortase) family protein
VLVRLLALLAAGLCVGGALHVTGAVALTGAARASAAAGPSGHGSTGSPGDAGAALDIASRVRRTPAEIETAPLDPHMAEAPGEGALVAAEPFVPVRLEVPSAGVQAPIDPLDLDEAGELEVPEQGARAGWWAGGSWAGAVGPTVVVGHVNSHGGQAGVFHALTLVEPGDRARLLSKQGRYLEYEVVAVETVAKRDFPTDDVYGATRGAELRLVTCGGPFNILRGAHRDNVIVYAELVDTD